MHAKILLLILTVLLSQCKSFTQDLVEKVSVFSKNNVEKSSLVFVFDTTGSMYDDLRQLKEGAELILNAALEEGSNVEDFVFVPFHDPAVGPATITQDKRIFKNALNIIDVYGGLDCPEMSLGGILLALESSRPKSQVYVFTDATAKDYDKLPQVLDKLQQTQSQVVFVLTGHCSDLKKPSYLAYQKVAAASSGQVFNLNKTSVHNVLDFVRDSLKGRRVNLCASVNTAGYNHTQMIPVDKTLGEVTVSVSGVKPQIKVVNPRGEELTGPPKLVKALDLLEIMIVKVLQPEPGNWSITVGSENEHSVKVVGLSNLTFNHGFSVETPQNIEQTSYRPLRGTYNHLLVQLIGPTSNVELHYAEIINLDGRTLFEVPFHSFDAAHNVYIAEAFIPPDEMFYISVNGRDNYGQELRRIGPTAVQAKSPEVPVLSSPVEIRAKPYETVVLECKIESLVPLTGMWMQYGRRIQEQISSLQTTTIKYTIINMSEANSGTYTCFAKNVAGVTTKDTELILIVDPPQVMISPENMTILSGSDVIISCIVNSYGILTKYQLFFNGTDQYAMDIGITPRLDGVYSYNKTLYSVTEANQGTYTCIAANKGGQSNHSTNLIIQSKPIVQLLGPHTIIQQTHTLLQIACQVEHAEIVIWREKDRDMKRERVGDSYLSMLEFNVTDDTVLTCVGKRGEYEATDSLSIRSLVKPQVNIIGPKKITLLRGESKQVICNITGKPPPRVVWHKETEIFLNHELLSLSPMVYQSIITINSTDLQNRTYFCIGENSVGIGEDSIDVSVRGKMMLLQGLTDQIVDIYSEVEFKCLINSYPPSTIIWYHNNTAINQRYLKENNTVLQVNRVDFNSTGEYACEARNGYEILRVNATLSLNQLEAPVLLKNPKTMTVRQGATTTVTCRILKGVPPPVITWYFNNRTVSGVTKNQSEILLHNITTNQQGIYKCTAVNILGEDVHELMLDVQYIHVGGGRKVQLKTGGELVLVCDAEGNPRPLVVWYFDGRPMVYNRNRFLSKSNELTVKNITEFDSGTYSCAATNVIGSQFGNFTVTVYEPPSLLSEPNTTQNRVTEVLEGQLVELPCHPRGIPTPDVTWTLNGHKVDNNRMYSDENGIRFVANLTDFGNVTCLVKNQFGNISKTYDLRVWVPPTIQPPLKVSVNIIIGANVSLNCDIVGFPLPAVRWKFQENPIKANTTTVSYNEVGNLYIKNVNVNHEGVYCCIAENRAGVAKKYFNLNVQEAPKLLEENYTRTYLATNLDSSIVIPCKVSGKPRPYILWSKDGFYLNSDEHFNISLDGTLTINKPMENHSGEYICMAKNIHGVVNKTVYVQIYSLPKNMHLEQSRTVLKVIEETNISIPCPFTTSHDTVKWFKNAELISIGNLNITNVSQHNESSFACVISNDAYTAYNIVDLHVEWPPRWTGKDNGTIEVVRGEDVYLDCNNDAKPQATIKWYINSSLINDEDKFGLKLTSIQFTQSGVYTCIANNEHGSISKMFYVQVLVPPFISEFDLLDVDLKVNTVATLECNPRGYPQPIVKWTFTNKNWTHLNNSLTTHISLNSEGIFRCDATNKAGRTHIVYRVNVVSDAKITEIIIFQNGKSQTVQKKGDVMIGKRIRIACYASGRPTPKIQWLRNGRILGENTNSMNQTLDSNEAIFYAEFLINSVERSHAGEYICAASNIVGVNESRISLSVLEPPQIIKTNMSDTSQFTKIEVILGKTFYLQCHPYGTPQPFIYWLKNGVELRFYDDRMTSSEFGEVISSSNARVEQAGNYTCVARNNLGNASVVYIVDVLVPPSPLKENHKSVTGRVSRNLTLNCPVDGVPLPIVTWIKLPYTKLKHSESIRIIEENHTLILTNPDTTDSGNYTCIMTNKVGTNQFTFNVTIESLPSIAGNVGDRNIERHVVPLQRSIVLKCEVEGFPTPKISWLKDNLKIPDTSSHIQNIQRTNIFVIWSIEVKHAATYICLAENTAGVAHRRYIVTVKVPGKYGIWSQWSLCNVTCGLGYQHRNRTCQYIDEDNNAIESNTNSDRIQLDETTCVGKSYDRRKCHMPVCEEEWSPSHWSAWSKWSECAVTCGEGSQIRTRKCRSRVQCDGDNFQIRKCPGLAACIVDTSEENPNDNEVYTDWIDDEQNSYIPQATYEMQPEVNMSPDVEEAYTYTPKSQMQDYYKARVTHNLDGSDQGPCDVGYRYNHTTEMCYDIDECQLIDNQCHATQTCVNLPGGYKCGCQPGYISHGLSRRCLDINECLQDKHWCEYACVNAAGGYICACPKHLRLHIDKHHCVVPSAYRKPFHQLTINERMISNVT